MSSTLYTSPTLDGFRMPAEHEPQDQVWMAWPTREDNWREKGKHAQAEFVAVATAIAQSTKVTFIVDDKHYEQARLALHDQIRVIKIPSDDCWMRDIGATYVINDLGERRANSWQFNAWGGELDGLYDSWEQDNAVAEKMAAVTDDYVYQVPLILEGGSIHVDGEGTLFTTEECLLHPSRNPHLSKKEIEDLLKAYLSVEKIVWLKNGLYNDETNGHVDNIMHVVRPGVVALTDCEDPSDPQYAISKAALKVLSETVDAKGRTLDIIKLPLPGPLFVSEDEAKNLLDSDSMNRQAGERLAASYANFLITNHSVIFPTFGEKTDDHAKDTLQKAFPNHNLIGVYARNILLGGGNIHCITQQVPMKRSIKEF
ncbi:agmatine deiminase [Marinomonas rhizomae]|uniref:Putative agmatine deiminase n=1 Tax=Marinomonas rhizomae TaxID=491948 RepID=A0A366JH34_9GAMM|nr:agmatine deiminase [Marinomonas rhizomae]RBP85634.1 agmatine deiminase [Marinomonas rhizomae]RNF75738.1 agmatine deiminase [Marinomonas rhizomae]